ncbi:hypothetical protein CVU82_02240 [Candidatus Falkowbacteria bacterium HGW-Falkowbacteria-1]|jgi:hypothetical protein|uniref:VCBS repeat-containing protein n=1 Tax=Candidatus Falkowbacteria bacterium HGW-Falkowbacteria-1 TaxID=2013768 RepID=A0A2N2E9H6_9BACT|nr:MAG: hypothetical protein CVU82_02240 [Candidatus Falkowbacteria bacterium HGW-Falkowbacteria-1]
MLNKKLKFSLFFFLFFFSILFLKNVEASPDVFNKYLNISNKSPKLANIFLSWEMSDEDLQKLAQWDLLILDMEYQVNSPEKILKLRQLNPNIIILAYINSQEIRNDVYLYENLTLRRKMFEAIPESWYLSFDKSKISFWPQTWMLNSSNLGQSYDGKRWNDFLPEFVDSEIISSGLWDGIFYDNLFDSIDWLNNGNIDLNGDGQKEGATQINDAWREGNVKMLKKTRELIGYDYVVLANSSSYEPYHKYLNGRIFENFPLPFKGDGSWQSTVDSYLSIYNINVNPKFYIFNSTENNFSDFSKMHFGLLSSLFFNDVYFSFDASVSNHGQTWFYDEYNLDFSKPKNNAYKIDNNIWRRDFEYFSILLNPNDYQFEFDFPDNFKEIYSWWNDNQTKINLGPRESIILEPQLKIYDTYFRNKAEYQAFNFLGKKVYTSYNLISDDFSDGELISQNEIGFNKTILLERDYEIDSNNNGFLEIVEGSLLRDKSLVKIYNHNNNLVGIFRAFPDQFKCGVRVAVGDVDADGKPEIVTMPYWGGPHVRIFDFFGNLEYEFFAKDKNLRAFYDLKLVDLNGNGKKEIFINSY